MFINQETPEEKMLRLLLNQYAPEGAPGNPVEGELFTRREGDHVWAYQNKEWIMAYRTDPVSLANSRGKVKAYG